MYDLREDLGDTWRAVSRQQSNQFGGPIIMFVAAGDGAGVTSIAASIAALASRRADKAVWLVDLDVRRNAVYKGFRQQKMRGFSAPGRAYDLSLQQEPIYKVVPDIATGEDLKLLSGHDIEGSRLFVTRFRNEHVRDGQRIILRNSPGWWTAMRRIADWIIVDAPALERSPAALTMASEMDGVVLVVEADKTEPQDIIEARREIESRGGTVIGTVMSQVGADVRFANRLVGI